MQISLIIKSVIRSEKYLFPPEKDFKKNLKRVLGFLPRNYELYQLAFVHKSASQIIFNNVRVNNDRLEFLGDSILDALIAEQLFLRFPEKDEGFLTQMRSKIVNRDNLNHIAMKLGVGDLLVSRMANGNHRSIYGDALEALIGALYLDKGFKTTRKIVLERIIQNHISFNKLMDTETDFKSRIIEWAQKNKKQLNFLCFEESEENNNPVFIAHLENDGEIIGRGVGTSKKEAERNAAKQALDSLGE